MLACVGSERSCGGEGKADGTRSVLAPGSSPCPPSVVPNDIRDHHETFASIELRLSEMKSDSLKLSEEVHALRKTLSADVEALRKSLTKEIEQCIMAELGTSIKEHLPEPASVEHDKVANQMQQISEPVKNGVTYESLKNLQDTFSIQLLASKDSLEIDLQGIRKDVEHLREALFLLKDDFKAMDQGSPRLEPTTLAGAPNAEATTPQKEMSFKLSSNDGLQKAHTKGAGETRMKRAIEKTTFWPEADEKDIKGHMLMSRRPVHVPSHAMCLLIYFSLMSIYIIYSIVIFLKTPAETSFSSEEASKFGPITLDIDVDCSYCFPYIDGITYKISSNYDGLPDCGQVGVVTLIDQPAPSVLFCRSSDDISEGSHGVDIWIGNISESTHGETKRAVVVVSQGVTKVTTPVERWHEKTLLLGLTVNRDAEDCVSSDDCQLERNAYLASMQYDGKTDWPAGGLVHIRMLRFAHVYTEIPVETPADIAARIGGASGLLILVLGLVRRILEMALVGKVEDVAATAVDTTKEAVNIL